LKQVPGERRKAIKGCVTGEVAREGFATTVSNRGGGGDPFPMNSRFANNRTKRKGGLKKKGKLRQKTQVCAYEVGKAGEKFREGNLQESRRVCSN